MQKIEHPGLRPKIVCICGSTRFHEEMQKAAWWLTFNGMIAIPVGAYGKSDEEWQIRDGTPLKENLLALHKHKIDMANEILVVTGQIGNVPHYVGKSTTDEIAYAKSLGKRIQHWVNVKPAGFDSKEKPPSPDEAHFGVDQAKPGDDQTAVERHTVVREQRSEQYGSPTMTLKCVAMQWSAILQAHLQNPLIKIPPHLVGLMMASLKIHRAAVPFEKPDDDNYVDCRNYMDFAMETDNTLKSNKIITEEFKCLLDVLDRAFGFTGEESGVLDSTIQRAEKAQSEKEREAAER